MLIHAQRIVKEELTFPACIEAQRIITSCFLAHIQAQRIKKVRVKFHTRPKIISLSAFIQ